MKVHSSTGTSQSPHTDWLISRIPFYYGWVIFIVATFGSIMTSPGQTYAVSILIEYFIHDLGISRSLVSTLYTAGTLLGSLALPFVGQLLDRRGAHFVGTCTAILFGIACIYMGYIQNALMLSIGFFTIRMLGQGSLSLICTNVVNQWWVRRRAPLLGFSGLIMALVGVGGFPNLINWLIPLYGWRNTYLLLGLSLLLLLVPVIWIFLRDKPENYGLLPDGGSTHQEQPSNGSSLSISFPALPIEENWTLAEASQTPIFWVFNLGLASMSMLGTGLTFHIVSIFADNGMSATVAASAFVPVAITTALTNLASGFLVDRIRLRALLAFALVMQAVSLFLVSYLSTVALAIAFGICLGMTNGLQRTVNTVAWAKYYGRLHLGTISGVTSTVLVAASALGPMPMGVARDLLGSYGATLNLLAVIPLGLAVASLFVDRPVKHLNS